MNELNAGLEYGRRVAVILLLGLISGIFTGCDSGLHAEHQSIAPSGMSLSETTVSLSLTVVSLRDAIKGVRRAPALTDLHRQLSRTSAPLIIVYEGRNHHYRRPAIASEELRAIDSQAAFALSCEDLRTCLEVQADGTPLSDSLARLFPPDVARVEVRDDDNVLLFLDVDLPDDYRWSLNRKLGESGMGPLTCAEAEKLLRESHGWELGPGAPKFSSAWCDSPDEIIWDGQKSDATVRDLLFVLLRQRARRLSTTTSPDYCVCFHILPLREDRDGNPRWNVLMLM